MLSIKSLNELVPIKVPMLYIDDCFHLGAVVKRFDNNCRSCWVRECSLYKDLCQHSASTAVTRTCQTCPSYEIV